jgi:hypothetical protein
MKFLKQSTAVVIPMGPFVDKTDRVTLKTDATTITDIDHATTGIFLVKNGGTGAIRHQSVTASVVDAYGMMLITLDATDTDTLGRLRVSFAMAATYIPVWEDFQVLSAAVFDALVTGNGFVLAVDQAVNLTKILGTAPTEGAGGRLAAAFTKFFDKATPTGTINSLPDAVAGANNGLATTNGTKIVQTVDLTAAQSIACSDKTGFKLAADGLDVVAAPADLANDTAARATFVGMFRALFNRFYNQVIQTGSAQTIHSDTGATVSTKSASDTGATQTLGKSA